MRNAFFSMLAILHNRALAQVEAVKYQNSMERLAGWKRHARKL